jgi:hypothetical protein
MGFWDVAGAIGKGVLNVAIHVAKEIPKQTGNMADRELKSNSDLSSERKEKLEKMVERGEIAREKERQEALAKRKA